MRYLRTNPRTKEDELWYFVEVAANPDFPDDPAKTKHVMRSAAGRTFHFPSADFPTQFRLVTASSPADVTDAYKETLANIRHNSTVRFVALPFVLTASAILANAHRADPWQAEPAVAWFGFGLAVIATIFEIALSRNLICWWKAIRPLSAADPWLAVKAHRSGWALWPVRYALLAPYLAGIYYWLTELCMLPNVAVGSAALAFVVATWVWSRGSNPSS